MTVSSSSKSAAVRARVGHPVIDADGHASPIGPDFLDYVRQVGGSRMAERWPALMAQEPRNRAVPAGRWNQASQEERSDSWVRRSAFWFFPTGNTLDRATAHLPRLMYERLPEMGIDFTILYLAITAVDYEDEELRRVACRASNMYHADLYREFADRITPAAAIPMYTPQEAIDELEYAVNTLGLKAAQISGHANRPIPPFHRKYPELDSYLYRLDTFGIDSQYDYDPVWAKFIELKVAPTTHSDAMDWTGRNSASNYMYNHVNHFGEAGEALVKSLFLGGVTRRFPQLRVAALECGVAWACSLYAGLIARWEKRSEEPMRRNQDPANLDVEGVLDLILQHGDERTRARMEQHRQALLRARSEPRPPVIDDFAACQIKRAEEIRDLFVPNFFFGCEADDPLTSWAFNSRVNPFGARLNALFSSDITHWDVPDLTEVLEEAWSLVEKGILSREDFRDFVFTNPAKLHAGMNPDFFKGTVVETEVANLLSRGI